MRTRVGFDDVHGCTSVAEHMDVRERRPAASTKWKKRVTRMGGPFAFVKTAESKNPPSGFDKALEGAEERRRVAASQAPDS